jgi:hypothetical protein
MSGRLNNLQGVLVFGTAKSGEYVTQETAIGPLGLEYKDAKDDPRSKAQPNSEL